jgi:signal transduction histidine kinase
MNLRDVLSVKQDEIMRRWRARVQGTIAPEAMSPVELMDHLPGFLTEIRFALEQDAGVSSVGPPSEERATAAVHGEQRLRLGFSLDSVVREYGALGDAVVAAARDAGVQITAREHHILSDTMIAGIAQAVTQYARQRDAELSRLANEHYAFIAHEIRNPLSTATMALQILKSKGLIPADGGPARALGRGLQAITELVDQTLQAARTASGIELRKQPITLATLFEEAESGALPEAETKGIELRLTITNDERISLDRRLVLSALGNLLRNAVKYSQAGCVVEARGRISAERIILEVEDCCGGLAPGKVEEAFAPFARLDQRESGFGLGLAIAKQAVDAHGGSIRVQNLPGKGCIFVLELPRDVT